MPSESTPGFRDTFAPGTPVPVRERLVAAEDARDAVAFAVLGAIVAVLFGVAGVALLVTGATPGGSSRLLFEAIAGGGCLLVAVFAGMYAVRGADHARWRRIAGRYGRYVGRHQLAALAENAPELGDAVRRAQSAVDRIRAAQAFRDGALSGAVDDDALDRIEWTLVRCALELAGGAPADRAELDAQVDRLVQLAGTAERITAALAGPAAPERVGPDPVSVDDLERAAAAAAEVERYLREVKDR